MLDAACLHVAKYVCLHDSEGGRGEEVVSLFLLPL
jgi:hypothetical protein